jgi:hypothetical protein
MAREAFLAFLAFFVLAASTSQAKAPLLFFCLSSEQPAPKKRDKQKKAPKSAKSES